MKKAGLVLLLIQFFYSSFSQCIDFDLPASACINQRIQIENLSSADNYEWDFCTGDFYTTPTAFNAGSISGVSDNRGIDIVFDGTNWYGFATGRSSNNIVRFDFGDDIESNPISVNLGNVGGVLNGPEPIKIIKENGLWYGLVHNGGGQSLVRLEFGGSLTNTPTASVVLNSVGGTSSKFDIGYSNDSLILVLVHFKSPSQLTIVNFNESILNTPGPSDYFTTPNIAAASWTSSISLIRQCDQWYGISENLFSSRAYLFSFGNTLFREPSAVEVGSDVYDPDSPTRSWVERDNNDYIIHTVMSNGNLHKLNAGDDLQSPTVVSVSNLGKLSQLNRTYSFKVVSVGTERYAFSTDRVTGKLIRMKFANTCETSVDFTKQETPPLISYENDGNYYIGLKAYDADGQLIDNIFKTVTVTSNTAPDIDFTTSFPISCTSNPISFTPISSADDIQFYDWDFGDGNTSTAQNPSHTYAAPGTYDIKLTVTDADPCENFTVGSITIYEDPVSTFDSPSGVVCNNQPVTFTNTTPDSFEGNETFEWQIDGVTVSNNRDLDYEFTSGGTFEVKLITTIPGCSDEAIQNFNVTEGPSPNFVVSDGCVGTLFDFSNTTTGDNIVSYQWDFDNGFMSSEENPDPFEYDSPGTFNVTLTTQNAAGCITSIEKSLTVYDPPVVDFSNELSCELDPTQFNDLSTVNNANIESWEWDFDDPASGSNSSIEQNPQHVFSQSGDYNVKLITTTTFGCIDSLTQTVSVNQAPSANFSFDKVCIGEEIQFQDESEAVPGEQLTNWAWNLGGEFSAQQNPNATFEFAIDYNVSLTVTSQNLCANTIQEVVTVYPATEVGFEIEDACENTLVHLFDTTEQTGDPIASRFWQLTEQQTATDSSIYYDFLTDGDYDISLIATTERGCEYVGSQNITINKAPEASFEASNIFGAPPLTVDFTNTSNTSVLYNWDFGDGNSSDNENPSNTFTDEGSYNVKLAIEDANGCRDTANLIINALIPELELELIQVTIVDKKIVLTMINNGTISIDSMQASINMGDRLTIEEDIMLPLPASNNPNAINYTLDLNLASRNIDYVCVTLNPILNGAEDANQINNTKCKNFDSDIIFIKPYPNPAKGQLNVTIMSETDGIGTIRIVSSIGKIVLSESFDGVRGKNDIELDISSIKAGVYLVEVEMAGFKSNSRVAIDN